MNTSDIKEVGIHNHLLQRMVGPLCGRLHGEGHGKGDMKKLFSSVIEDPEEWIGHKILGEFAEKVIEFEETGPRDEAVNYSVFGRAKMGPTPGPRYVNKNSGEPEFAAHPEAVTEAAYAAAQFHQ